MDLTPLAGFLLAHHIRRTLLVNPEGYSPYLDIYYRGYLRLLMTREYDRALRQEYIKMKKEELQKAINESQELLYDLVVAVKNEEPEELVQSLTDKYVNLSKEIQGAFYGG